jgi:uncharacterized protein YxeA
MKFILGLLVGLMLGVVGATAYVLHAQLAPFDAPLDKQIDGQRAESWLRLEREAERAREWEPPAYSRRSPCP